MSWLTGCPWLIFYPTFDSEFKSRPKGKTLALLTLLVQALRLDEECEAWRYVYVMKVEISVGQKQSKGKVAFPIRDGENPREIAQTFVTELQELLAKQDRPIFINMKGLPESLAYGLVKVLRHSDWDRVYFSTVKVSVGQKQSKGKIAFPIRDGEDPREIAQTFVTELQELLAKQNRLFVFDMVR